MPLLRRSALQLAAGLFLTSLATTAGAIDILPRGKEPIPQPGSADTPTESVESAAPTGKKKKAIGDEKADLPPIKSDEKRPVPDYDNRGDEPTTAGDVLIWVPRVALSPLYFVSEFVVRRPLGFVATTVEKNHLPTLLVDFFTFGPERNAGIVPTFLIDFGFRPSFGFYFWWNKAFADNNDIRIRAATGGFDWLKLNVRDRIHLSRNETFNVIGAFSRRPDHSFWGLGPESGPESGRYKRELLDGALSYEAGLWRSSSFSAAMGVRDMSYDPNSHALGGVSLRERIDSGVILEPPGLDTGFTVFYQAIDAALDTRRLRHLQQFRPGSDFESPPGTGVRLALRGEHDASWRRLPPAQQSGNIHPHWVKYGGALSGFWDITGEQRVLGLSVLSDFVDPIDSSEIPFTELASLGGPRALRGFRTERFLDRSAVAANLEYRWPVWVFFDGVMDFTVGNVFGPHLNGFDWPLLRGSYDIGIQTVGSTDHVFEILFGFGTKPLGETFAIEQYRFVIGASSGF